MTWALAPGEECDRRPAEHRRINPVEVRRDQYVDEGLKKLGLTVDDISAIVISHCHWDHIGGLEFFKGTRAIRNVYVPYADFAHALVQTHRTPAGYSDSGYYRRNLDVEGAEFHLLEEETTLFPGVDVLLLEGHTPAVAGLVLHLDSGNYILPSDAVTAEVCLRGTAAPASFTTPSASSGRGNVCSGWSRSCMRPLFSPTIRGTFPSIFWVSGSNDRYISCDLCCT